MEAFQPQLVGTVRARPPQMPNSLRESLFQQVSPGFTLPTPEQRIPRIYRQAMAQGYQVIKTHKDSHTVAISGALQNERT